MSALLDSLPVSNRFKRLTWLAANSDLELRMSSIEQYILRNDPEAAVSSIKTIAKLLPSRLNSLQESVRILADEPLLGLDSDLILEPHWTPSKENLILVSGMTASGSSAVFDYLSEFHDVVPVETEIPHLGRGRESLYSIWSSLHQPNRLRALTVRFFLRYLVGIYLFESSNDLRVQKFARLEIENGKYETYSLVLRKCATVLRMLTLEEDLDARKQLFQTLLSLVLEEIVAGQPLSGKVLLLNNALKIGNLSAASMFESVSTFAVLRDPRDTYVAEVLESINRGIPVEPWIARFRKNRELADSLFREFEFKSAKYPLFKVQFERFVLSEAQRNTLIQRSSLTKRHVRRHEKFKHWESERNIGIHRKDEFEREVAIISRDLSFYCVS